MQHFLQVSDLSINDLELLVTRALHFKYQDHYPHYLQYPVANLFYENSTRTRISFELAAKNLSMPVINVDIEHSSEQKGEVIEDTIQNLAAMGITHFVIRHSKNELPSHLARHIKEPIHIINAGDGQHAHPSQALLDFMTITEHKPDIHLLKIAILGDIKHSRVASSLQSLFKIIEPKELVLIAPDLWQPQTPNFGRITNDIHEGLEDADVVICLRAQNERLEEAEFLDLREYWEKFTLTEAKFAQCKPNAMIMHPGPINRGMEIESALADGKNSYILQQVKNGVYMRMAILEACIG